MTQSLNRAVWVEIGDFRLEYPTLSGNQGWTIEAAVKKTFTGELNSAELTLFNLSSEARRAATTPDALVRIGAGYMGPSRDPRNAELLFQGTLDSGSHQHDGAEHITNITARTRHGSSALTSSQRISLDTRTAIKQLLDKLEGADVAAAKRDLDNVVFRENTQQLRRGRAVSGDLWEEIERLIGYSEDATITNRDGVVVVHYSNKSVERIPALSPSTGLIGSPTITVERGAGALGGNVANSNGFVQTARVKSLLRPEIQPRSLLEVEVRDLALTGRVRTVEHQVSTKNTEFYTTATIEIETINQLIEQVGGPRATTTAVQV